MCPLVSFSTQALIFPLAASGFPTKSVSSTWTGLTEFTNRVSKIYWDTSLATSGFPTKSVSSTWTGFTKFLTNRVSTIYWDTSLATLGLPTKSVSSTWTGFTDFTHRAFTFHYDTSLAQGSPQNQSALPEQGLQNLLTVFPRFTRLPGYLRVPHKISQLYLNRVNKIFY